MIPYFKDGNYSKGILQGYKAAAAKIAQGYNTELSGVKYQAPASQPQKNTGSGLDDLLFALGVIGFLIVDNLLLGGFFTRILLLLIFRGGGRGQAAPAPDHHDLVRLHPRRRAHARGQRGRRGQPPCPGHRRLWRHDRRHHPWRLLRAGAVLRHPTAGVTWRGEA